MTRKYSKVIGCGGIGKGLIFHSVDNETLGRNESRLVTLSKAKDYCKLQLVFFYTAQLLSGNAKVYPIGAVGNDSIGDVLLNLMNRQGMVTDYIEKVNDYPTMLSVCLQYPEKEGCNISASNSAAGEVSPRYIRKTLGSIGVNEDSILVAVPEVRIESRVKFLREGKEKGAFCAASIPVSEAHEFEQAGVYELCDLIAVNQDEARAICGSGLSGEGLFIKTCEYLCNWNKDIQLVVTEGADGAWCGNSQFREYLKPYPANVVNTTGAGDAFLGATIGMISQGFPLIHSGREEFPYTATQVAAVCSGIAIGLEDSIPKSLDKEEVFSRLKQYIQA